MTTFIILFVIFQSWLSQIPQTDSCTFLSEHYHYLSLVRGKRAFDNLS